MKAKKFYELNHGKKYGLGRIDCFKMIYEYMKTSMDVPTTFRGLTAENYVDLYNQDPEKAIEEMIAFFESTLTEKKPYQFLTGDVLILEYEKEHAIFPGIFLSNINVIVVTIKDGVRLAPLNAYKIRRCFECPH